MQLQIAAASVRQQDGPALSTPVVTVSKRERSPRVAGGGPSALGLASCELPARGSSRPRAGAPAGTRHRQRWSAYALRVAW
jgi:hypothetical protein